MDKRIGSSAGLLALLAVVLHTYTGTAEKSSGPSSPKQESAAIASAKPAAPKILDSEGPWRATQQYFHQDPSPNAAAACSEYLLPTPGVKSSASCNRAALASLYAFAPDSSPSQVSALIATVPDPLHTRMSVETDRYLDAIQQAAYRSNWELATQWLPWTLKADPSAPLPASHFGAKDVDIEELPGLLVFRHHFVHDTATSALLLVFVVGETPTAGINGYQFEIARRSLLTLGTSQPARIAIVGPNFSGSFLSLTRLIQEDTQPHDYQIRAGSVSNSHYAETMLHDLTAAGFNLDHPEANRRSVTFHGSTLPSSAFQQQFRSLIAEWRYSETQVAELIEDETGFSYQSPADSQAQPGPKKPSHPAIAIYRYPRDIAQLRNAYSDIAFSSSQKQESAANPRPELSLKDTQAGEDSFPIFSSSHTPVSQNAVLEQIVRDLNRKSIRLVSLSSTNIFDTMFLAKVLARYCPDTRIVLNGADLLFVQESAQGSLTGLMAISPFPMFPDGSDWLRGADRDATTFADSDSIGEFNAALSLLHGDSRERQALGPPLKSGTFFSAWLLVLGRLGWSPVRLLPEINPRLTIDDQRQTTWFDPAEKSLASDSLLSRTPLPQTSSICNVLCLLVAALILAFCSRLLYLSCRRGLLVWSALCLDELSGKRRPISQIVHFRYLCLLSCLSALSFMAGLVLGPLMAARFVYHSPLTNDWALESLAVAAFLLPLAISVVLFCRIPVRVCTASPAASCAIKPPIAVFGILLRAAIILLPLTALINWWRSCSDGVHGWLLCFRALSLSTPVSPVLPLLLLAVAIFALAFFHLRRFTWVDRQQPVLETGVFDEALWGQFSELKQRLDCVLVSPTPCGSAHRLPMLPFAVVAALALLCVLMPVESLRSFEPRRFELLLLAMLMPLSVFATLTLVQFASCWSIFRAFLVTLNSLVLGRFFTRLPDFNGSGPVWIREVKLMSLGTAVNSCIALHNLQHTLPLMTHWRDQYWGALTRFLSTRQCSGGRSDFIRHYGEFRRTAAEITDFLSRNILKPYWGTHVLPFLEDPAADIKTETQKRPENDTAEQEMILNALSQDTYLRSAAVAGGGSVAAVHVKVIPIPGAEAANPAQPDSVGPISSEAYQLASKYVVLQYSAFIGYALRHLQNMLLCCVTCFVLTVLALNSFTFQAPQTISYFLIGALLAGGAIIIRVLAQIERDAILSRMSGTEEGELGKDFYVRLLTYGALPVLTVLGTQFPSIAHFLSAWAEPTIAAVR